MTCFTRRSLLAIVCTSTLFASLPACSDAHGSSNASDLPRAYVDEDPSGGGAACDAGGPWDMHPSPAIPDVGSVCDGLPPPPDLGTPTDGAILYDGGRPSSGFVTCCEGGKITTCACADAGCTAPAFHSCAEGACAVPPAKCP